MADFYLSELQKFKKDQLTKLLEYYGIEYSPTMTKAQLIDLIPQVALDDPTVPKYSVRVQRIIDINGGRVP